MSKQEEGKQTMWETWFAISLILVLVIFIIGVMDNSRINFPNWPYFAVIIVSNLLLCIKIGIYKK